MAIPRTPAQIRKIFYDTIDKMERKSDQFVNRPGKDFSRHRICTFKDTILTIITKETHGLKRELYEFYKVHAKTCPTKSAFSQSRGKLNSTVFPYLLNAFNDRIPFTKTYKGLHLLACDGTDSNIPADKEDSLTFIPFNSNNGGYYQFHTVVMYDLLEKRYTDAIIQPRREMQEVDACCRMIDRNPVHGKCLFIADRGFESFNLMAHAIENDQFFLIRVKNIDQEKSSYKYTDLSLDDECETSCKFVLSRKNTKLQKEHPERYKRLFPHRKFDFIAKDDRESTYTLAFRLIKILLPNGTYEYLVTNLPEKKFHLHEIKSLYAMRWGVEGAFLLLKYNMAMNYFHSVNRDSIVQEIFAKLILYNFISLIISCASVPIKNTKYHFQISLSDAIYKCRDYLLKKMPNATIIELLLRDITPIRPYRSYERNMRTQRLRSLQNRT